MKISAMRFLFFLLGLIGSSCLQAQDITGIWRGHFRETTSRKLLADYDDRYRLEVQIAQHSKTLEGVTYSYLSTIFYGKAAAKGAINMSNGKFVVQEFKLLEVRDLGGDIYLMTYFLKYSKIADDEFLEGNYSSVSMRDSSMTGRGTVFLHKVRESDFYKEPFVEKREKEIALDKDKPAVKHNVPPPPVNKNTPPVTAKTNSAKQKIAAGNNKPVTAGKPKQPAKQKTPSPALAKVNTEKHLVQPLRHDSSVKTENRQAPSAPLPQALANRKNELVKTIVVNTGDIELNIYDDGAIDHDTVSVYLDKKLVISHAMLTDKAIVLKLHLDDIDDYHEVVMVAENEGEIPPNTSLMVVKAGDKQYEVRIVSTEQKNATVVFKYEKAK